MLSHIYIRDFAIIREIDLDLSEGLNIISGETGTGKSIVIQAVNTALGGRGSAAMVADGAKKALVQLVFTIRDEEAAGLGRFAETCEDGQAIFSREITASGRSTARINGEIVKLSELAAAASHLADIHGQYDNQFFLNPARHIEIIDSCAADRIGPVKEKLKAAFLDYQQKRRDLIRFRKDRGEYIRQRDFMQYELAEINACDPKAGEDEELEERARVLANGEKIFDTLSQCYDIIYNSNIEGCASMLSELRDYSSSYARLSEQVSDCAYALSDIQEEIRRARDSAVFSPEELDRVMSRIDAIDNLKRKYGGTIESVLAHRDEAERALSLSEDSDEMEKQLKDQYVKAREKVLSLSAELTEARRAASDIFEKEMTGELAELNFSSAVFKVEITEHVNAKGQPVLTANGTDTVQFRFTSNKNAALKPLAEIASGGEISRISLAFKSIMGSASMIGTMIFDEIDTGISGRTASVVGRKMRKIAADHQVICITHLPQIAAAGDCEYLISRDDEQGESYTTITRLDGEDRVLEIARLLGGTNITETTLKSARELIEASK
ncbi:MAG: DNA repair protein RecN [Anaerovoracaceae bacterium]|nr:DNA repair protein RecN [Bacillota bacterium]MDY2671419.1 DNA repair protein RecN [Anaerovoracaceae bacterium]